MTTRQHNFHLKTGAYYIPDNVTKHQSFQWNIMSSFGSDMLYKVHSNVTAQSFSDLSSPPPPIQSICNKRRYDARLYRQEKTVWLFTNYKQRRHRLPDKKLSRSNPNLVVAFYTECPKHVCRKSLYRTWLIVWCVTLQLRPNVIDPFLYSVFCGCAVIKKKTRVVDEKMLTSMRAVGEKCARES